MLPVQLAKTIDIEVLKTWSTYNWEIVTVQPKIDGFRLIWDGKQFLSRAGKHLYHLEYFENKVKNCKLVLDGEIKGKDWNDTSSITRAYKSERDASRLVFTVFDALTQDEWKAKRCELSLNVRQLRMYEELRLLIEDKSSRINCIQDYGVTSFKEFTRIYEKFLSVGCDGAMIKPVIGSYEFKRSSAWLKVKPRHAHEAVIVGMVEGKGKHAGRLGALVCMRSVCDMETFKCDGMTDVERQTMWDNKNEYLGLTISYFCRGFHKKTGAPIEPKFDRIRRDLC